MESPSATARFAAMLRRASLVNWLKDIFPGTAARSGLCIAAGPVGALLRGLRNGSLRREATNVVLGERMAAEVGRLAPHASLRVVPNLRASRDELREIGKRARAAFERKWDEPIALPRWRGVISEAENIRL